MMTGRFRWRVVCLLTGLLVLAEPAAAYQFWPTAGEWNAWPAWCRARYSRTGIGSRSEYARLVSNEEYSRWEGTLGRPFVTIHHHCAGMLWLQRAQFETDSRQRQEALKKARNESLFTFERVDEGHPMFGQIAVHLGMVARASGNREEALQKFELAMRTHPDLPGGWQGASLVLEDRGDLKGARQLLEEADAKFESKSAEIHYFLGLLLVKLKDFDGASAHARSAYELGYPLPGLRRKLAAAGHPLD